MGCFTCPFALYAYLLPLCCTKRMVFAYFSVEFFANLMGAAEFFANLMGATFYVYI